MHSKRSVLVFVLMKLIFHRLVSCEILQIENGRIEGITMTSRMGESFHAFRSIPFAEPPLNELRFLAPRPNLPWNDVLDCTDFGPLCMQEDLWNGGRNISEDCLQLNVFTKNLPVDGNTELKPVIIFLHGGGFEFGTAIDNGPEYMMDRDIVLVTPNYRLGTFGFMAIETAEIPGNAGLKDQTLAFKWVQKNIRHFGGDPDRVTIAGLSAGAYSTTSHMVSPMSQGLFHRVIAMSGAITWQMGLKRNNIDVVRNLARKINCAAEDLEGITKCLRDALATIIAENMRVPFFYCPVMTWIPVIEPNLGQERFLHEEPNKLFREGKFEKVNVIIGITDIEYTSPVAEILSDPNATRILNEKFDEIAPGAIFFEANELKTEKEIGKILRDAYLPFDVIDVRSFNSLANLFADGIIGYGVHRFVHFVSKFTNVYYYKFSFVGRTSYLMFPRDKPYGAHHVDDLQYLFNIEFMATTPIQPILPTDRENIVVERLTRIWAQFAETGDPNNSTDEYLSEMMWPKHDAETEFYMDIGTHLIEKNGLYLERFVVWDSLEMSSGWKTKVNIFLLFVTMSFISWMKQLKA